MRWDLVSRWALAAGLVVTSCSRTNDRPVRSQTYRPTAAERRAEERRAEERAEERAAERREAERAADERARRRREIGGGPSDHVSRETAPSASTTIARVRCDREVKCNRIGSRGKYESRDACVAELKRDVERELDGSCTNGVSAKELNDCLQAIRDQQCGDVDLDTTLRLAACRADSLCVK